MKRNKNRRLVFLAAIAVIFALSTSYYSAKAEKYARYMEYSNERALSELITQLSEMDSSLSKLRYASTPKSFQTISAKLWQSSMTAKNAMAALRLEAGTIDQTQKFVAQTGDFAYYLLFKSSGNGGISLDSMAGIDSLYEASEAITREINAVKGQMDIGQLSSGMFSDSPSFEASPALADGLSGVEQEFPEYATLIYDGPFSEHMSYLRPRLIENMSEITEEQAAKNAASFLDEPASGLSLLYEEGGKIESYCFSDSEGFATAEVSKRGGIVYAMRRPRQVSKSLLSPDEAIEKAEIFLENHNFRNMKYSYYNTFDNTMTVNFAYTQNGITVYSDLIKVSIALDNGEIVGMEARGYLMSHCDRSLPAPKVTAEEGLEKISPRLTVESVSLALIPTSGKSEVLCHEYVCRDEDNMHIIVYINAQTGQEENIFMLLEDENGCLAI